ncbi:MAG: hypothetical protein QM708_09615 [Propioniciclava sp.]|uniref:hypothetical protein n=1 Tax=Propioniciclava sp. TaxID=2038686 RepID=UPI0039E324EB
MMKARWRMLGALVLTGALAFTAIPASATSGRGHSHAAKAYVCTGGEIPSGTYSSIIVKGQCAVANDAKITVKGNIDVRAGALLDAQSAPSTITVGGNVYGARGAMVGLGCQAPTHTGNSAHPCMSDPENGKSTITVKGDVKLTKPAAVMINGITVRSIKVAGGGSYEIPWSIKNNTVNGSVLLSGQKTWWIGVLFNKIKRDLVLTHIKLDDPHPAENPDSEDMLFVVRNDIGRHAACMYVTKGITGYGNTIGKRALGQCSSLVSSQP